MNELLQDLMGQLVPILIPVLGTLGSLAMVYMNRWLKTKVGGEATTIIGQLVESVVNDVRVSIAEPLKEVAADGKLSPMEALDVKRRALAEIKKRMPKTIAKTATQAIGDLDKYISGQIEKAVQQAKPPGNGNHHDAS